MEDLQLSLTVARTDQRNFGVWLRSWQVGHILQALVIDKGPSGDLVLRVGGQQITATADFPVQRGAQLLLQIASLSPTPLLKLLKMDVPTGSGVNPQNAYNAQMQVLLPRQVQVHEPLVQLAKILTNDKKPSFSTEQARHFQALLQSMAVPLSKLDSGAALRQILRRSGLWQGTGGSLQEPEQNLKKQLFSMLRLLGGKQDFVQKPVTESGKCAPNQNIGDESSDIVKLRQLLEGAVARITLNQLDAVKANERSAPQWLVEVPVLNEGEFQLLQLMICRDQQGSKGKKPEQTPGWRVELTLETRELGPIQADVFLREETISATFYTCRQHVVERIEQSLPALKARLQEFGLEVPVLVCQQGARKQSKYGLSTEGILVEKV